MMYKPNAGISLILHIFEIHHNHVICVIYIETELFRGQCLAVCDTFAIISLCYMSFLYIQNVPITLIGVGELL